MDTREASVSNPCLVLLPNLSAVVPAPSMLLGNLANRVLHRIQVCMWCHGDALVLPAFCHHLQSLHFWKSRGKIASALQVHHVPCWGLGRGCSASAQTFLTGPAITWIRQHIHASHLNSSTSVTVVLLRVCATCLVF